MVLQVSCVKYEEDESDGQTLVMYCVSVRDRERALDYEVKKRYSSFLNLYTELQSKLPDSYKFPNKSLFNNRSKATLNRRQQGFNDLLNLLTSLKPLPEELEVFLELNEHLIKTPQGLSSTNVIGGSDIVAIGGSGSRSGGNGGDAASAETSNITNNSNSNSSSIGSPQKSSQAVKKKPSRLQLKMRTAVPIISIISMLIAAVLYLLLVYYDIVDISATTSARIVMAVLSIALLLAYVMAIIAREVFRAQHRKLKILSKTKKTA